MDAVQRVAVALIEIERARAERDCRGPAAMPPAQGPFFSGSRAIIAAVGVQRGHSALRATVARPRQDMPCLPTPMP